MPGFVADQPPRSEDRSHAQATMIGATAAGHGVSISTVAAAELILPFTAGAVSRTASQWLIGWTPGYGNALNGATAASFTETIGWAAHAYFKPPEPAEPMPPPVPSPEPLQ